jgi:hypothetical protein
MVHAPPHPLAMKADPFGSIGKIGADDGGVEVDESFVGGKLENMHKGRAKNCVMPR